MTVSLFWVSIRTRLPNKKVRQQGVDERKNANSNIKRVRSWIIRRPLGGLLLPGFYNTLCPDGNHFRFLAEGIAAKSFSSEEYFDGEERVNISLDDVDDSSTN